LWTQHQVLIIDCGLAKKYRNSHGHVHIPYVEGKSLIGTPRIASLGTLRRIACAGHSRAKICQVKSRTSAEDLRRGFAAEFGRYFHEIRAPELSGSFRSLFVS
jgi:hypothetical protein